LASLSIPPSTFAVGMPLAYAFERRWLSV
jgi:hypothetical protein